MRRSIGLFIAASSLPVIILGSAFWTTSLKTQQTAYRQLASDRARFASALIERELAANIRSVEMLTQSPAFDDGLDAAWFELLGRRLVADEPSWRALSVSNSEGVRVLDVPRPVAGQAGGRVVEQASLQRAVSTGGPAVGQVTVGPNGREAFAVRAPVVRDGEVKLVVSAVVDPQALGRLLVAEGLPQGWRADLADGAGRLVASTSASPPPLAPPARSLAPGFFQTGEEQGEVFIARAVPGSDWSVRVSMPASEYRAPARQATQVLGGAVLACLLLSGLMVSILVAELRRRRRTELATAELMRLEALGLMTGGVAHDFNNLLTPVLGGLDLLQRRLGDDPRSLRLVEAALQSAERARTLVARLLAFARRQDLRAQDVDVHGLLRGLADLIQGSVGGAIRLSLRIAEDLPAARVDPGQLELAILNLALNARDAMPAGGELSIEADLRAGGQGVAARLPAGPYVRIAVTDTGAGMDAETLRKAVDPFFTTKAVGKGTGLGLSMVDGLAAQSGGALYLSSKPGVGTTAEVWLPASTAPAGSVAEPEALTPTRPAVLLLVDDDEVVRAATKELLTDAGHTVFEAGSANEGLRVLKAEPRVEAIVTDYAMPFRSGAEFISDARALRPGLPALIITGYAAAADLPPDVPRLAKPFRRTALLNAVADLLRTLDVVEPV